MGKYIYLLLAVALLGCEKAVIERPNPFAKSEKALIFLDFSYLESASTSGFVRFTNLSNGFKSYRWDFDYTDAAGRRVTSTEANPFALFPTNGEYLVILRGIDINGQLQTTHQYILVTNKPG